MTEHITAPGATPVDAPEYEDEEKTGEIPIARILSSATPERDRLSLLVLSGGQPGRAIAIERTGAVFGRGQDPDIQFDDEGLSRRHARIFPYEGAWYIEDLASTNGTWLAGRPLRSPTQLREGDRIQAGKTVLLRVSFHDATEQEAAIQLYETAVRDPLCRVYNRRYMNERLEGEMAYALRHRTPLSVLLLDIDHFKPINDTRGHQAGDAVLRVMGGALQKMVRAEDMVARYGGEEFVVVARGIDPRNAILFADRIRRTIAGFQIPWEDRPIQITVSVGVATLCEGRDYADVSALLAAADQALYEAKAKGRNRCIGAS